MITDPLLSKLIEVTYALVLTPLLGLSAYRISRFFTTDKLTETPRNWLEGKLGKWAYGASCNWCLGFWTTAIFFFILWQFIWIPFLPIVFLATLTIVGFLGNAD